MMMRGGARHSCGTDSPARLLESITPHDATLKAQTLAQVRQQRHLLVFYFFVFFRGGGIKYFEEEAPLMPSTKRAKSLKN